jgi:hypothetical protein
MAAKMTEMAEPKVCPIRSERRMSSASASAD